MLSRFSGDPVSTGDENRAPQGGSYGDMRRADRDHDDWQSCRRAGGEYGGDPGDPDDPRDPSDRKDHGDRGDRDQRQRRGARDVHQGGPRHHNGDESGSSRRQDNDDGSSSAFLPVG